MGDFIGFSQNPAVVHNTVTPQLIMLLMSRARVTLLPTNFDVTNESEITYIMPPTVSRLRAWTHRTAKPSIIGPSGTRGVWIQRPNNVRPRLIAWTAARDTDPEEDNDVQPEQAQEGQTSTSEHTTRDSRAVAIPVATNWPRDGAPDETVMQGWNALPRGRARKVDMYPVRVEDVKRIAFDEGTGRTCLAMRNGEVHVLDFA
jgi:hypothetical protein